MKKAEKMATGETVNQPDTGDVSKATGTGAAGDAAKPVIEDDSTIIAAPASTDAGTVGDMVAGVVESHEGFDPLFHAVNPDGTPKRKVDGSYAMKRGRKSGAAPTTNSAPAQSVQTTATINADEAARQSCNMLINGAVLLLGDQWEPRDKDEAKGMHTSFKNYFEARGVPNVPPEVGLVIAMLAYSLPRITHEKTVSRFSVIKMRAFEIWQAIRGK